MWYTVFIFLVCRGEASSWGGREEGQWRVHTAPPSWRTGASGGGEEEAGRETARGWWETCKIAQWRIGECPNSLALGYSLQQFPGVFFYFLSNIY